MICIAGGDHFAVHCKDKFIDANGGVNSLDKLRDNSGIEYQVFLDDSFYNIDLKTLVIKSDIEYYIKQIQYQINKIIEKREKMGKSNLENKELAGKLGEAIALASEVFKGKTDKSGEPYILHCLAVMENVKHYNDRELSIAAVLHDVIEDTNITAYDLKRVYEFSDRVVQIVESVTFKKGCTDDEYFLQIMKICENQDSIKLKMADIQHNSLVLRMKGINDKDMARTKKYHKAYFILQNHLLD